MNNPATTALRVGPFLLMLAALVGLAPAQAQDAPDLGEEFIFFVDGTNVKVPFSDAQTVNDPVEPTSGNKVAKFDYGNWTHSGFRWERTVGADASAMVTNEFAQNATLNFDILSDPANAGQAGVWIMFTDKTDDSGADDGTADLEFRAIWEIPQEFHDGAWHTVSVTLPPATLEALNAGKDDGSIDGLAANWDYPGAWSMGGFGVGPGFGTDTDDPLWQEFEWSNVKNFGVMFDNSTGGGPIYVDNLFIGDPATDLSTASEPPAPMDNISVSADGSVNVVTWTPNEAFGGYNVYVSDAEITDVTADNVALVGTKAFDADAFEVRHAYEAPHPELATGGLHYAITSLSEFGVENPDVSASSTSFSNEQIDVQPMIIQLTGDEADQLFNNLSNGLASGDGFPETYQPFVIGPERQTPGDVTVLPDDASDLDARFWLGYSDFNELFLYAEVTDDVMQFGGETQPAGEFWQFDSIEMGWGNYDVRNVEGGSILAGSPHLEFERGDEPDYQFRLAPRNDGAGGISGAFAFASTLTTPEAEGELQGGGSVADVLTDDSGNPIGWKILSLIPLDAIQFDGTGDVVLDPPAAGEIRYIPFNLAINDADGNTREHQVLWTNEANAGANWWNTPAQWEVVAMTGRATLTANEDEASVPGTFTLEQNYPNPFNPATTIRFSLAQPEQVRLTVYNVLGQQVATLVDGQPMTAGAHSVAFDARDLASGVYLYRLEAGASFVQTKQMLLIK